MLLSRCRQRAFTLIEILVSMTVAAILLFMAAPSYTQWIADAQTRAAAESLASGLRMTMAEAVKRNTSVEFVLDPTTNTGSWTVQPPTPPGGPSYGSAGFAEGSPLATFTVVPVGLTTVTFTGLGTVAAANADATLPFQVVNVATAAGSRPLRVLVGGTRTGIKICDPGWPATDPKGCPPLGG